MANVFAWVKNEAGTVLHVVEEIPHGCDVVLRLLADSQQVEPAVKAALSTLLHDAEQIALSVSAIAATNGASWTADAAAVAQVETLVADFLKVLPQIESNGKKLLQDVKK
jgi:hypothetical protein